MDPSHPDVVRVLANLMRQTNLSTDSDSDSHPDTRAEKSRLFEEFGQLRIDADKSPLTVPTANSSSLTPSYPDNVVRVRTRTGDQDALSDSFPVNSLPPPVVRDSLKKAIEFAIRSHGFLRHRGCSILIDADGTFVDDLKIFEGLPFEDGDPEDVFHLEIIGLGRVVIFAKEENISVVNAKVTLKNVIIADMREDVSSPLFAVEQRGRLSLECVFAKCPEVIVFVII